MRIRFRTSSSIRAPRGGQTRASQMPRTWKRSRLCGCSLVGKRDPSPKLVCTGNSHSSQLCPSTSTTLLWKPMSNVSPLSTNWGLRKDSSVVRLNATSVR
ncbi:hypothetical protein MRX96_020972 [Rhipicephalus microplus]